MRFIPTRIHGVLDYAVGILLVALPWLLGFADGTAAQWVPVVLGLGAIGSALVTDYELGVVPLIPMPLHLALDAASGIVLAASPWLFGFADRVWVPHVVLGLTEIVVPLLTATTPPRGGAERRA